MVDNRVINPISSTGFNDSNSMANKMSDEKQGQGGEYFFNQVEEEQEQKKEVFQDRSAQLRASLDGLAISNAASVQFMKTLKEKEEKKKKKTSDNVEEEDYDDIWLEEGDIDDLTVGEGSEK